MINKLHKTLLLAFWVSKCTSNSSEIVEWLFPRLHQRYFLSQQRVPWFQRLIVSKSMQLLCTAAFWAGRYTVVEGGFRGVLVCYTMLLPRWSVNMDGTTLLGTLTTMPTILSTVLPTLPPVVLPNLPGASRCDWKCCKLLQEIWHLYLL